MRNAYKVLVGNSQNKRRLMRPRNRWDVDITPNEIFIRAIKSRSMRWAEHVARMGEIRNTYAILVGEPEGRGNHSENVGVDRGIILLYNGS
jgi:hypothetical protein